MSGFMGGGGASQPSVTKASGIDVQSSIFGSAIPVRYGRNRGTVNLIWYGDFVATEQKSAAGGKGGGGEQVTGYSYRAALAMCLGEGVVSAVYDAWKGTTHHTAITTPATTLTVSNEPHRVPTSTPYSVTVANVSAITGNLGVVFDSGGEDGAITLTQVSSSPVGYQYTYSSGVYTFSSDMAWLPVNISYQYAVPEITTSALSRLGLTLINGQLGQSPWGYLTSKHPTQALGYSGMSYVCSGSYDLGTNSGLDNHGFEIQGNFGFSSTVPDCNPKDVLVDVLTNAVYGAGFPSGKIGDLTSFSNYCVASGLFVSPHYTEQTEVQQSLADLTEALNCAPLFSGGLLRIIPRGDATVTGNGATYTPNLSPLFDLGDDDFLGDGDEDPVKVTRSPSADAFNSARLTYKNRSNQYNDETVEASDMGDIDLYGRRPDSGVDYSFITTANVANAVCQMRLQRKLYIRNTYEFRLGWRYCLLEPMDIVTLTDEGLGLDRAPVRIQTIEEDEYGELTVTAEELPIGVASAALYDKQSSSSTGNDRNALPGACQAPVVFEPPLSLSGGRNDVWMAVAGQTENWGGAYVWVSFDGVSYQQAGTITTAARFGTLEASIAAPTANPDETNVVDVELSVDKQLLSGSQADVDNYATLCRVGNELLAYRDSTLTAAQRYTLAYLRRGLYGTAAAAHLAGSSFVRLDSAIFKYAPDSALIGKMIYIKLTSFNSFGQATESLSNVSVYSYTIQGGAPAGPDNLSLQSDFVGTSFVAQWSPVSGASSYAVEFWSQGVKRRTVSTTATTVVYSLEDSISDGGPWRDYTVMVSTVSGSQTSGKSQFQVSNPTPDSVSGITTSAMATSITINWGACLDVDLQDYQVWISTTSGFSPSSTTLAWTGTETSATITGLTSSTTYYLRVAARDKWGAATLNYSAQVSKTTSS